MLVPLGTHLKNNRNETHFCANCYVRLCGFGVSRSHSLGTMRQCDALESVLREATSLLSISVRHAYAHLSA